MLISIARASRSSPRSPLAHSRSRVALGLAVQGRNLIAINDDPARFCFHIVADRLLLCPFLEFWLVSMVLPGEYVAIVPIER